MLIFFQSYPFEIKLSTRVRSQITQKGIEMDVAQWKIRCILEQPCSELILHIAYLLCI